MLRRPLLVALLVSSALGAEDWSLNGTEPRMDADGSVIYTRGFVGRRGGDTLVADAVRIDHARQILYASGQVVFRRAMAEGPDLRITASRLGLDHLRMQGEAWEVTARMEYQGRTVEMAADHLELEQDVITLHDVDITLGHGSNVSFWAPTARILLRDPPPEQRGNPQGRLAGIELVSPTGKVCGLPVLWLPWIYRDFSRDYPWTVVRAGHSTRLGTWGRFWIGSHLPDLGGWRTTLEARVDRHSRAGNGGGLNLRWVHPQFGQGRIDTYAMREETTRDVDRHELADRQVRAYDAEHRTNLGSGAFYARTLEVPEPDAPAALKDPDGTRFLSDFLPDSLEQRPFPRKTAAIAYTVEGVTVTVDTERRHTLGIDRTERFLGIETTVAPIQLAGPLHLGANGWVERLNREATETSANRLTGQGYLTAGQWLPGGVGFDGTAGLKTLGYGNGLIQGQSQELNTDRRAAYGEGGVSWRLVGHFRSVTHTITPRVGFEAVGYGTGDILPRYDFQDSREVFEEDKRYWVTGLATAIITNRTLFHADVKARWAMRPEERLYYDADNRQQEGPTNLVDVSGGADGSPVTGLTLTAGFFYDARPREWISADGAALYRVTPWLMLHHETSLRTRAVGTLRTWEHRPAITFLSGRYNLTAGPTFRPADRAPFDAWRFELSRAMVEGDLFLSYELIRDALGDVHDRRYGLGFTLGGAKNPEDGPRQRWAYNPR